MSPCNCPRFLTCNASVCPLDPRWRLAVHLDGEPVCHYLRNAGKAGAAERFADDRVFHACLTLLAEVPRRHPATDVRPLWTRGPCRLPPRHVPKSKALAMAVIADHAFGGNGPQKGSPAGEPAGDGQAPRPKLRYARGTSPEWRRKVAEQMH